MALLVICGGHFAAVAELPRLHGDPFDTSRDCWHEPPEQIVDYRACWADRAMMVFTKR